MSDVKAQYELYPYPPRPFTEANEGFHLPASFEIAQYARCRRALSDQGKRALVAGCGTGFDLHGVAANNPGLAEIVGIDFSAKALEVAKDRISHHKLSRCQVFSANLSKRDELPEGPFDFILAFDVLNEGEDSSRTLAHLAELLAEDGVMGIEVPGAAGLWPFLQVRRGLEALQCSRIELPDRVKLLRAMIAAARPGTLLHMLTTGSENESLYRHDADLVHAFLTARSGPMHVDEIPAWLEGAGLEMMEMADSTRWRLGAVVDPTCKPFYERISQIDPMERLRVIESLHPFHNDKMVFWACRKGSLTATFEFDQELFLSSEWKAGEAFKRFAQIEEDEENDTVNLSWPLFYPNGRAAWRRNWQQNLLDELRAGAVAGRDILQGAPAQNHAEIVKWFYNWEKDMVVMRL